MTELSLKKNNMNYLTSLLPKINLQEIILGVSLGTGYMTSLRFLGPIGISELLMFLFISILVINNIKKTFIFPDNEYGKIKLFMLSTVTVVFPLFTGIFYFFSEMGSEPIYILSFIAGCFLSFLLAENINNKINMHNVTLWFAITFIFANIVFSQVNPDVLSTVRYSGAAKNPNQLVFYATSLTLLLVIYNKFAALICSPFILYFMLRVGSDAYILSLYVSAILFFIFYFLFLINLNKKLKITFLLFVTLTILVISSTLYSQEIKNLWLNADEGNSRTTLMYNALIASIKSPLFGYGAGSFSTFDFNNNAEAHNTFLDLAMQFGFLFPIIIYYIFIKYFLYKFEQKKSLECAFFIAFIISGLFHFSGRHFVFWVEIGVFMSFIYFQPQKAKTLKKLKH